MTPTAKISRTADPEWLDVASAQAGRVPSGARTPHLYVTVMDDDEPVLRVDVHADESECFAVEDAIVWRGNVIIGFGNLSRRELPAPGVGDPTVAHGSRSLDRVDE